MARFKVPKIQNILLSLRKAEIGMFRCFNDEGFIFKPLAGIANYLILIPTTSVQFTIFMNEALFACPLFLNIYNEIL